MDNLTVTEYKDMRVLTTRQIAEAYETDGKVISNNFNRNKERYKEGKHYICLKGDDKKNFINHHQIDDGLKNATVIYLWTKKGAFLHAKSLNTDVAWEVYERLIDEYFNKKDNEVPTDYPAALRAYADEVERRQIAEQEKEKLQIELDYSKDWYSIKRVSSKNGVSHKEFDWRILKSKSIEAGYGVKKIFDANYGEVNTYHKDVWEEVYPEYEL